MDGATLLKSAMKRYKNTTIAADDIDGNCYESCFCLSYCCFFFFVIGKEIIDDPSDVVISNKKSVVGPLSGFIMSKWETVDPEQVEAQAMTTSKWDLLGSSADPSQDGSANENQDSNDYTDSRYEKMQGNVVESCDDRKYLW
jgi:U2-associated protein SR140